MSERGRVRAEVPIAQDLPVAQVLIDSPLPHLDRLFDYAVPAKLSDIAIPGVRVRIRFAGRLTDGWLIARSAHSEHKGELAALHAVVSPEVVLVPEILELCTLVAARWAGNLSDVIRSAVPSRHARAEAVPTDLAETFESCAEGPLSAFHGGQGLLERLTQDLQPHAMVVTDGDDPAEVCAQVAHASSGTVIVVVPDRTACERVIHHLRKREVPESQIAQLLADDGPEKRYRNWLRVLRGQVRIVVGTRSSVFAPAHQLRAICIWDDWDESLYDPQAPYWNARDVAVLRSTSQHCGLVLVSASMSTEAAALGAWLVPVRREMAMPTVRSSQDDTFAADVKTRIPSVAMKALRDGLRVGPVLVLVARAGYQPRLVCDHCREPAQCRNCSGALVKTSHSGAALCGHCGTVNDAWECPHCSRNRLRAPVVGSDRTAEELGRAFPGIPVRSSSGDHIIRTVDSRPAIVVATPGAVPVPEKSYSAAVLLDANAMLSRPDLRAGEDAFARWREVVGMTSHTGNVAIVGPSSHPAIQALIRHDPVGFAQREFEARAELGLPPAVRMVALTGRAQDVAAVVEAVVRPADVVRGPMPLAQSQVRTLITCQREVAPALMTSIRGEIVARAAKRTGEPVSVRIDPRTV